MSYCVGAIIAIRTGGVFADPVDVGDMARRIGIVVKRLNTQCVDNGISAELTGTKGAYVVIAGIWNGWMPAEILEFAKALSAEFQSETIAVAHDEEKDAFSFNAYLGGTPLGEVEENPLGRILRRIS